VALGAALVGRNKNDKAVTVFQNAYNAAPGAARQQIQGASFHSELAFKAATLPVTSSLSETVKRSGKLGCQMVGSVKRYEV
jgi:hypothetical protein